MRTYHYTYKKYLVSLVNCRIITSKRFCIDICLHADQMVLFSIFFYTFGISHYMKLVSLIVTKSIWRNFCRSLCFNWSWSAKLIQRILWYTKGAFQIFLNCFRPKCYCWSLLCEQNNISIAFNWSYISFHKQMVLQLYFSESWPLNVLVKPIQVYEVHV